MAVPTASSDYWIVELSLRAAGCKQLHPTGENVQGSLYPALHRLEDRELVCSECGVSDNNRRAKFYRLTAKGRKELRTATSRWRRMTRAIGLILGEANG
jgi:DNA-binding PadR family transcriptional regulator